MRTLDVASERHASALELFFDLVFVVAVAELSGILEHQPTVDGFIHYAALFVPVWWTWVGYTFYADRFDSDDLFYRLIVLIAMLATGAVAVSIPGAFASMRGGASFAGSYAVLRLVLVGLYARAHYHEPRGRPLSGRYLAFFSASVLLWTISIVVAESLRYVLWAIAMLCELLPPLVSSAAIRKVPYHHSHIPERFGSFTIIVLGESVALLAVAVDEAHLDAGVAFAATAGFVIAACFWWMYFEFVDAAPLRRGLVAGQTYTYGHLVIFASITATGVGARVAASDQTTNAAYSGACIALAAGAGAFLLAIGIIHLVTLRSVHDRRVQARIGLGAALMFVAFIGNPLGLRGIEAVVAATLLLAIIAETRFGPTGLAPAQVIASDVDQPVRSDTDK